MKNNILKSLLLTACITCLSVFFVGCEENTKNTTEYTITYYVESGVQTLKLKQGDVYTITVPEKNGYDFLGLFDQDYGGVQYVSANGVALSPFNDAKNLILYPQYKEKEYTLVLDYQGSKVSGVGYKKLAYDSVISDLPLNLTKDYHNFIGWFTEPNCQGIQVSGSVLGEMADVKFNDNKFDIQENTEEITLYAGFELVKYTVTLYLEENNSPEEILVEHGTFISDVTTPALANGESVIAWSIIKNDVNKERLFTGKVDRDMILYAAEYGYVLSFDSTGGSSEKNIIVQKGQSASLPKPSLDGYKFVGWYSEEDNQMVTNQTPILKTMVLTAKWCITKGEYLACVENGDRDKTITDSDTNNYSETINPMLDVKTLRNLGCTQVRITISIDVREINDGYQEIFVYSSGGKQIYYKNFEHGSGYKDTAWGKHTFEFITSINNVSDSGSFSIKYGAYGDLNDDWSLGRSYFSVEAL